MGTLAALWKGRPIVVAESIKLLIGNTMAFLIGFGLLHWDARQTALFLGLVNSTIGIILTLFTQDASVPTAKLTDAELVKISGRKAA
jgi:hypothetical protein